MWVVWRGLCGVVREQQDQEATGAIDRGTEETHVTSINSIRLTLLGWLVGWLIGRLYRLVGWIGWFG